MGIRDLFKSHRNESAANSFESLLDVLAHGNDEQTVSLLYRGEHLSQGARQSCVNLLSYHFRSPFSEQGLIEKSRHQSGKFTLLILAPSWKDDVEQNIVPLIVTGQGEQSRGAGVMLPFDDLTGILSEKECSEIGALTAVWVIGKQQSHSASATPNNSLNRSAS
jgi:hypothetical protein